MSKHACSPGASRPMTPTSQASAWAASPAEAPRTRSPSSPQCRPPSRDRLSAKSVVAPATLVTDGLGRFTAVRGTGIRHEQHITGGGALSAKHPSFVAVNTALGNLKTALAGTYHAFAFDKYAHRYLRQVQYLFNRRFDLRTILGRLARVASLARPCPLRALRAVRAVRAAELPC